MAGNARTSKFMLSTATVMVGALADLHELNPAVHSLGLVKNFQFTGEPAFTELMQGIRNAVAMSVKTGDGLRSSMEVYEFTPKNIAYAAGLETEGAGFTVNQELSALTAAVQPAATEISIAPNFLQPVAAGDYLFIQKGQDDYVHIVKVASAAAGAVTLDASFAIPAGMSFPVGARVGKLAKIPVGGSTVQPEYSAKIVGLLPKDNTPFTILMPKVKITRGLGLSFAADNFTNMPFEFTPYQMNMEDPFYEEYGDALAVLFAR